MLALVYTLLILVLASMNDQTFSKFVGDLISVFGNENFPEPRLNLIWNEVKNLDENQFKKICKIIK